MDNAQLLAELISVYTTTSTTSVNGGTAVDTSYEVDTVAVPPLTEVMLVVVYTDMSSASSCALSIFPTTYPFFDRGNNF